MDQPVPRNTRYEALDAWRGIVCVIVVLEHAGVCLWTEGEGFTGVWEQIRSWVIRGLTWNLGAPLFFVISGYCIASSLQSSRRKGVAPSRFLARRFWRIFPPYWASVLIIGVLVLVLDRLGLSWLHATGVGLELASPVDLNCWQWVGNVTLTETWRPHVVGIETLLLNRVAWALCYQEQFYLICFLALLLFPNHLYRALGVASVAILGFELAIWDSGRDHLFTGFFPELWHEFAVGLALYWRLNVAKTPTEKRMVELGMATLLAIGWSQGMVKTVASAGFGLLLIACFRWDQAIARVRQFDGLRACGRRSYAVYLIHLPVCTVGNSLLAAAGLSGFFLRLLVMVPVVTVASLAAGWAFYHMIDRNFTRLPSFGGSRTQDDPGPGLARSRPALVVLNAWSGTDLENKGVH